MNRKLRINRIFIFFVLVLTMLGSVPASLHEAPLAHGDLAGHIYEKDGITPVAQAIVQIKRLPNGEVYSSGLSDGQGMFRIRNIEKGVYILGVKTDVGNFNGQRLLGILVSADVTARLEIRLSSRIEDSDDRLFVPLLAQPVGQVSIVAGNGFIFEGITVLDDKPREAGPFRIRFPE